MTDCVEGRRLWPVRHRPHLLRPECGGGFKAQRTNSMRTAAAPKWLSLTMAVCHAPAPPRLAAGASAERPAGHSARGVR